MALGPDASYSSGSKIYIKQQPSGATLNSNAITTEEVSDVGSLQSQYGLMAFNGQVVAQKVSITTAKGSSNVCQVTITALDNGGQPVTGVPFDVDVILSDNANGVGVTATAPSGGVSFTAGTSLNAYVNNKAYYVQTNASGQIVFNITDTGKTGYYIMVQGQCTTVPEVSAQLTSASYG